jgi:uncharacterized membrane protein
MIAYLLYYGMFLVLLGIYLVWILKTGRQGSIFWIMGIAFFTATVAVIINQMGYL